MIDVERDELLTPAELAARIPTLGGHKTTPSVVTRWITVGIHGVRLEAIRIGKRYATTFVAWQAFARVQNGQPAPQKFRPSEADLITDRQLEQLGV